MLSSLPVLSIGVVVSLVGLSYSAGKFVKSSSMIATSLKISPLVIGVVLMGFGTSLPEMFVSAQAALSGSGELALGNIVGSNTVNMSIVLGVGAIMTTVFVAGSVVKKEAMLAVVGVALYAAAIIFFSGARIFAGLALVAFGGYAIWSQLAAHPRQEMEEDEFVREVEDELIHEQAGSRVSTGKLAALSVLSLVLLVGFAQLLVFSATGVADNLQLNEVVVGVVLLAFGTSLPELASVVVAARQGEHDLIAGNLWGSTLFNSVFVGGVALLAGDAPVTSWWTLVIPLIVALTAWFFTATGLKIVRWEGVGLVFLGFAAVTALVLFP